MKTAAVNPMTLTVRIGDAGVLELDAGVTLTAQSATTPDGPLAPGAYTAADLPAHLAGDGRPQRPGIYGGPGSGAANVLPRISGPGLLHVWRTDLGGTLLILR